MFGGMKRKALRFSRMLLKDVGAKGKYPIEDREREVDAMTILFVS
jgi:hypothetical protein